MKKKGLILVLFVAVLFSFTACLSTEKGKNSENGGRGGAISDAKNQSYVMTLDSYIATIRSKINEGRYKTYDTSVLYLFAVGRKPFNIESGENSPYSKEWKYAFVGVKYDGDGFKYYVMSLDGSDIGTNFRSSNTLEIDSIEKLEEVGTFKNLYNLTENTLYESNDMSNDLKQLTNISGTENIQVFIK